MQPAELEPLRCWLQESTGLQADLLGRQRLERAVALRMSVCQVETVLGYNQRLLQDPAEQQRLIEALVVGESWFLREARSFGQLVELVRRQRQRPLRVLSCGCAGGEEPYSVVISLLEAGLSLQQLDVEAIDISAAALLRAREGLYGSHSLRGMDSRRLQRFFDREGRRWRLRPEIRGAVRFHRGTLQQRLNSLSPGWHAVFCRNVMLYLHDEARLDLLLAIADRLAPDGLLLVAAAEAALVPASRYRRLKGGHAAGFGLQNADSSPQGAASNTAVLLPPAAVRHAPVQKPQRSTARQSWAPSRSPMTAPPPAVADAQRCLPAAAGPGPSAVAPPSPLLVPEVHLTAARQLQQLGHPEQALTALRRCLYLDPSHREALGLWVELAAALGRHQEAEQLRRRLARGNARDNT